MDLLWDGVRQAFWLIVKGDRDVWRIVLLSLEVSSSATLVSLFVGIPMGAFLGLSRFRGSTLAIALINTGMSAPPVVIGLFVSILLWRSGPLGVLNLIYTPAAMITAQVIIATPIITGVSMAAIAQLDPKLRLQMLGLGASRFQMLWTLFQEARLPLLTAVMAGFGGVVSEVGAVMMVGGNIKDHTRVLTTSIVTETSRGNFGLAIAMGIILLVVAFLITLGLTILQQKSRLQR